MRKIFSYFLSIFIISAFTAESQIVKLKSFEGYISTKDSIKLFYRVTGEGKDTILVVHGGPYNFRYLSPDLSPLAAHHTIIYYDQRGSGFSSFVADTAKLNIRKHLDDIETIRKYFNIEKLKLLGHSSGGLISAHYVANYPDKVQSLMVINPAPLDTTWNSPVRRDSITKLLLQQNRVKYRNAPTDFRKSCWDYYALVARDYFPTPVHTRRMWGDVCYSLQENMMNPNRGYEQKTMSRINIIPILAKVKIPVLVLSGDSDFFPYPSFEQWKSSFPNSDIVRFKGAGHFPHVDDPNIFFAAVEMFLQGKFPDTSIYNLKGAGVILPDDDKASPYRQARAAVIRIESELVGLANKADWTGVASLYSIDGTIYAPGAPPIVGQQGIASFWHTVAVRGMHSLELQLMDIEFSNELLNARGKYVMRDKDDKYLDIGKFTATYKKVQNKWVLQTDIFNSSLETWSPIQEPDYLILDKK